MKSLKSLFTVIACCLLTACASSTPPARVPPANLMVLCPQIQTIPPSADMGVLLSADIDLAEQYHECAARMRGLVEWARSAK